MDLGFLQPSPGRQRSAEVVLGLVEIRFEAHGVTEGLDREIQLPVVDEGRRQIIMGQERRGVLGERVLPKGQPAPVDLRLLQGQEGEDDEYDATNGIQRSGSAGPAVSRARPRVRLARAGETPGQARAGEHDGSDSGQVLVVIGHERVPHGIDIGKPQRRQQRPAVEERRDERRPTDPAAP